MHPSRRADRKPYSPFFYDVHIEIHTTAPVTIRVVGPDSLHGTVEITVSSGPTADAELIAHPAGEGPTAPLPCSCILHRRVVRAFTVHLSDRNRARLDNLCEHSGRGQMKCRICHLNKALAAHLAEWQEVDRHKAEFAPLAYRAIPRALRTGPKGPPPPFVHALAIHLSDANQAGLDRLASSNPNFEGALDMLVNKALHHRLDKFSASDCYRRRTKRKKRTTAKPKARPKSKK